MKQECNCCGKEIIRRDGAGRPKLRCDDCDFAYNQGYRAGLKKKKRDQMREQSTQEAVGA